MSAAVSDAITWCAVTPRRFAVVSDIHGNLLALQAVAAEIDAAAVDAVVNLGDIVSGPLWPQSTVQWLMQRERQARPPWFTLAGNHERQVLTLPPERQGRSDAAAHAALGDVERAWLASLPGIAWLGREVFACHGRPDSDLRYLMETLTGDLGQSGSRGLRPATGAELDQRLGALSAELVLCGHSHLPRLMRSADRLVLNPGSLGLQAYDDAEGRAHWVENGHPLACWALVEHGPAGWQVSLRSTSYDHELAARRADSQGRPDWADALRTGRVGRTEADLARLSGA